MSAMSQSGFVPAIIVNNTGDSLHGKVNYHDWKKTPASIDFISFTNEKRNFNASSIRSFYILPTQERYESFIVDIDMTPADYVKVVAARILNPLSEQKQVFLLQIIKSTSLNFYVFKDHNKSHLYYSKDDGRPVELIDQYLFVEESESLRHNETYKQQLTSLAASCPEAVQKINNLSYSEDKVKKVMVQYLQCVNPVEVAEIKKDNSFFMRFGIVAGAMYNHFKFKGNGPLPKGSFSSNLSPVIGVSLDLALSRNHSRWHIVNEIIYKKYATGSRIFTHTFMYDYTTDVNISFSYLQLNTLLRYVFETGSSVKPYINAGMGNGYLFSVNKNTSHETYTTGNEKNYPAIDIPEKYERSLIAGAGINILNMQLEARYAGGNGFSPFVKLKSKISSQQLIFTYRF
ncbi:MAG: hypothetical protein JWM28_2786 [Chitinophagaceae bacterium]|nr:hypothetical protein [Chitinophagaceae bacterium]